ncbi:MAG: N-acetyltransferase [Microthrixaceae bacterium]|nr:N-acetyltransferase [Microthrixaceae bacterium]MCO5313768.1 N-acetyltransferase [Microthrixaceae bacterium]
MTDPATDTLSFANDADHHRFVLTDGDVLLGFIEYELSDGLWDLQHTVIEPTARGRGLGSDLAARAFAYIAERDERFIPTCTFLPGVLDRFPRFADHARSPEQR